MNSLAKDAFDYWENGNTQIGVNAPLNDFENLKPFVVRGSKELSKCSGWIPVNVFLFAHTKEEALQRVLDSLEDVTQLSYRDRKGWHKTKENDWGMPSTAITGYSKNSENMTCVFKKGANQWKFITEKLSDLPYFRPLNVTVSPQNVLKN